MQEKEARRDEKLRFTCKCSFLEIYNEQILDLLEPSSNNLQVWITFLLKVLTNWLCLQKNTLLVKDRDFYIFEFSSLYINSFKNIEQVLL
jgi:hypothetical protein